jgi:hypothetical protein
MDAAFKTQVVMDIKMKNLSSGILLFNLKQEARVLKHKLF